MGKNLQRSLQLSWPRYGRRVTSVEWNGSCQCNVFNIRPVFHECAETHAETPKMMCLLTIYFCSIKHVHGNDPYHLFRFEISARWNVRVSAYMENGLKARFPWRRKRALFGELKNRTWINDKGRFHARDFARKNTLAEEIVARFLFSRSRFIRSIECACVEMISRARV